MATNPPADRDMSTYLEAVIAAILTTAVLRNQVVNNEAAIKAHKEMLQALRRNGGPFN